MKTTPESWHYLPEFDAVVVVQGNEVKAVADFGKTTLPEKEANARLMGAAKELLKALEVVRDCPEFIHLFPGTKELIFQAIKKATGE